MQMTISQFRELAEEGEKRILKMEAQDEQLRKFEEETKF